MVDLKNITLYKNPNDNWKEEKINGRNISIPCDWKHDSIKNISYKIMEGGTPPTNNKKNYENGTINWAIVDDIKTKINSTKNMISEEGFKNSSTCFWQKGDIIITTGATVGNVGINNLDNLTTKQGIMGISLKENINNYYILQELLKNKSIIKQKSNGSTFLSLPKHQLLKINMLLTSSIEEQEKIASILETQENLIDSKKELLEKYKKQRKYFQQELLSGRIRMKLNNKSMAEAFELGLIKQTFLNDANEVVEYGGDTITNVIIDIIDKDCFENWLSIDFENKIEFYKNIDFKEEKLNPRKVIIPNDWILCNLLDYFEIKRGRVISKEFIQNNKGEYPVYSSATLNNGCIGKINTFDYDLKCVTWTTDGYAGKLSYRDGKFNVTNICGVLTPKKENINLYLFSLIAQKDTYLLRATTYSNSKVMASHISTLKFYLPNNLIEQNLIATQLTKIDNLIESLEEEIKLEDKKFTYLKQELLSGRIRVN